jgi:dTDP-4-amino-4,6-dideoxygalactose transaminase
MIDKPIYVTQPYLPPLEEFIPYLEQIWENKVLTNNGPFHKQLEEALSEYLGVEHLSLFTNGTIALVTAFQALGISGEVITTPYSFVATAHSLLWNNINPVFVDIDPKTGNLDPDRIEEAITSQTTAILPVHCYGNPCDVSRIKKIADNYNLKVIYDAAHAFGVKYMGEGLLKHGDLSVISFHATKVFNTFEGGAIVCQDEMTKHRIDGLKNFGFVDEVTVTATGINGKMSEINAAFGLLQLKYIDKVLARRRDIELFYQQELSGTDGINILAPSSDTIGNGSYFPIYVGSSFPLTRDALYDRLKAQGINCRRYFYPLISDFSMYRGIPSASRSRLPYAASLSDSVICLPIYPALTSEDLHRIVAAIKQV